MTDLFTLSEKAINGEVNDQPFNRISLKLFELTDNIAMVEAFSHSIVFKTEEGLVVFDTSNEQCGKPVVKAIREWSNDRFNSIVYTHGHIDHVGGSAEFLADVKANGHPMPRVIAHENILKRFDRYELTADYNTIINQRQFGKLFSGKMTVIGKSTFLPQSTIRPNIIYSDRLAFRAGELDVVLHYGKGETDDHTWAWIPKYKAICAGDFFIWNFPNAGNPQKVQRYPLEWAQTLKVMAAQDAEYFFPAHGLPIRGRDRIRMILLDAAEALDSLVTQTLEMMNTGVALSDIIHSVSIPPETLAKPYLRPLYDEPEFVVRNIWRLYGGWYDGNPANLKPASDRAIAAEIAELTGGGDKLSDRAEQLAKAGDFRLACFLIESALLAEPDNHRIHEIRINIYTERRKAEKSLMAKGIFRHAAIDSKAYLEKIAERGQN